MFSVDATQLDKCKELKNKRFDKIAFLISCIPFLSSRSRNSDKYDGEIFLSLKSGLPYDNWNIKNIIKSIGNLVIRATNPFIPSQYPGYQHRRTLGFQEGISKSDNEEITDKKAKILLIGKKEESKKSKKRR
ncbi:9852_t:CDS:2 [Diversispora eburnea]|uniref:9852_t:CDS:1 n=1 Tax=Diversispora eburnea TaxID=1213867 RepID=A0A9N9AKH1_9GLOM|nr:9852_t:CDS:2 [Diversispora eburnea]